jgi:hypothetical protein
MKILLTSQSFGEKKKNKKEEEKHKKSYKFAFNQICFLCFAKKAENRKKNSQHRHIKNLFLVRDKISFIDEINE